MCARLYVFRVTLGRVIEVQITTGPADCRPSLRVSYDIERCSGHEISFSSSRNITTSGSRRRIQPVILEGLTPSPFSLPISTLLSPSPSPALQPPCLSLSNLSFHHYPSVCSMTSPMKYSGGVVWGALLEHHLTFVWQPPIVSAESSSLEHA